MRRRIIGLAAAVALALAGTLVLVGYVRSARAAALAGEQLVQVLVVDEPVARGTPGPDIAPLVRVEQVPAKVAAEGVVGDLASLTGLVASVDLLPGEQVVAGRFRSAATVGGAEVPPGLLQVTVQLEPQRALGGRVRAGDTVGVLVSFGDGPSTHLRLHKVLVAGVQGAISDGTAPGADAVAPTGALLVTLALPAPAVEDVVFAAEHGTLWLSAEPADAPEDGTRIVTRSDFGGAA